MEFSSDTRLKLNNKCNSTSNYGFSNSETFGQFSVGEGSRPLFLTAVQTFKSRQFAASAIACSQDDAVLVQLTSIGVPLGP